LDPSDSRPENTVLLVSSQKSLVKKISSVMTSDFPYLALFSLESGSKGLTQIYQTPPALIMVDSTLSDISGLQLCRVLKHDPVIRKIPIMMITKESTAEYERFSELSLIADAFVEEKNLEEDFAKQVQMLLNLFKGLEKEEREQLNLLQQDAVQVQAMNRLVQLYDQSITEVTLMKGFRKLFEMIPSKNILHHMLFSLLEHTLDYDIAGVFFNDRNREARSISFHIPENIVLKDKDDQFKAWTDQIFDELKTQSTEPWVFNSTRYEVLQAEFFEQPGKTVAIKHQRVFPFHVENNLAGALVFLNRKEINYDLIFPFHLIMQEMSALMRLRRYFSEAESLTLTDSLTGLYTHQHFIWSLDREIRQAKRHESPLTLALFSVDNFKDLNLKGGYEVGDKVMQHLAHHMLQTCRSIDLLARAGGSKILALFPNTSVESAITAVERIQNVVQEKPPLANDQPIELNLNIGLVGLQEGINSATDFIEQAQKAVEQAREKGQNCVELLQ
jgi:diguanylate cyclase (GGDEF)-like protein